MSPEELVALYTASGSDDGSRRRDVVFAERYLDGWEVVEDGEWVQEGKYQHIDRVIKHTESGRCFGVSAGRSGSYHTDWYFQYHNDIYEVVQATRTVTETYWEIVK